MTYERYLYSLIERLYVGRENTQFEAMRRHYQRIYKQTAEIS